MCSVWPARARLGKLPRLSPCARTRVECASGYTVPIRCKRRFYRQVFSGFSLPTAVMELIGAAAAQQWQREHHRFGWKWRYQNELGIQPCTAWWQASAATPTCRPPPWRGPCRT